MPKKMQPEKQVLQLRELLNLSQSEFANKIGITQGALSQLEAAKVTISLTTLYKINHAFNVDFNWLIKGIGKPFDEDKLPKPDKTKQLAEGIIALVNEEAHAGYISQHDDTDYLETLDVYKIPGYDNGGDYRLFEITGDSMLPTLHAHETVICERIDKKNITLTSGALAIVVTGEGLLAKRVYIDDDKTRLILRSDNSKYEDTEIALKAVLELWAIRAKITSNFAQESSDHEKINQLESEIEKIKQQLLAISEQLNSQTDPT